MTTFLQTLFDGVRIGSLYALIALGYTMVYGILQFINFAHGDVVMAGAWIAYLLAHAMTIAAGGAHPLVAALASLVGAMLLCAILGFLIERLAYRPLRHAPKLNVLITAIGVSLLIQNVGQLQFVFGTEPKTMPPLLPDSVLFTIAGARVQRLDCLIILLTVLLMGLLHWLVYSTRFGLAMRAVSFDRRIAALMGVPVERVVCITFVVGSALAAAGGFLYVSKYRVLNQPAEMNWLLLGLKAFVAAVVGGIGNIHGAMLGGLLIGLVEQFTRAYLQARNIPDLSDVCVFLLLILVLLLRPNGLLGSVQPEKV